MHWLGRGRRRTVTAGSWPSPLVIADEHAGLAAAVRRFLPEVRHQRCTVHLQRNVLAKVPHRLRKRVHE